MTDASTVLVYHPNKILFQRLSPFIQAAGYVVLGTGNRDELLRLFREMRPDTVLLIPLAPADFAVAEAVHTADPSQRLVVLAETDGLMERAQAAGVDEVVLYEEADIGNVLEALSGPDARQTPEPQREEGPGILIVEDEPDGREMFSEYLARCGYQVFEAATGKEALEAIQRHPEIRAVLLDIKLPDIGGIQVLREIAALRGAPGVVMVTALADSVIAQQALRLGACDYLVKPIEFGALDTAITACLARQECAPHHWWQRRRA